ncbi:MAG: fasciclin domain-containing protein [Cyanobacteria bacterium J06642_2]
MATRGRSLLAQQRHGHRIWLWQSASVALLFLVGLVVSARAASRVQPVVAPEGPQSTPSPIVGPVAAEAGSIAAVLRVPSEFSELVGMASSTGQLAIWERAEPLTVFAPTNGAFAAVPEVIRQTLALPEYQPLLTEILRGHVVRERVTLETIPAEPLASVAGTKLTLNRSNADRVAVNQAAVIQADIQTRNGIIHVIDALLPPTDAAAIAIAFRISTPDEVAIALTKRVQIPSLSTPSQAWGFARLRYDAATRQVAISGFFDGLSSSPQAIGLSALNLFRAPVGEVGPIVRPLELQLGSDGLSGTFKAQFTLTSLESAQFERGEFYLNLHTQANPTGELRGQLRAAPGKTDLEDGAIEFEPR